LSEAAPNPAREESLARIQIFCEETSSFGQRGIQEVPPCVGPGIADVIAASIMATVNAMVTVGPRVYYAMAVSPSPRWQPSQR
jgi:hypothetical protein